jgi:hypothetical protein
MGEGCIHHGSRLGQSIERLEHPQFADPTCDPVMSVMIPETCPSKATAGEKRLFHLLRDQLPESFLAWYEPIIQGKHPDFILFGNDFGLLMLEAKGWSIGQIVKATDQQVDLARTVAGKIVTETVDHPIRQVRRYALALVDELQRPMFSILCTAQGDYQGRPCFPYGYGVVLSNITRAQLDDSGLSLVFPPDWAITRDELAAAESEGTDGLIARLRRLFRISFPFSPLTPDQARTLKGVIHREVVVKRRPASRASVAADQPLLPGAMVLDVLDAEQEQAARAMGEGHRVVFGIAGSGKTMLLLARARLAVAGEPDRRVLVLCYNKALARHLGGQLRDPEYRQIEVRSFHAWATARTGLRRDGNEPFEAYEKRLVARLAETVGQLDEAKKYDTILIDEAHDFEPDWLRGVTASLRGGEAGNLLIAADGAQSLYGRKSSFTWKSVGVNAAGRSRQLTRNYRNTKQILEFAWEVTQSSVADDTATETHVRVLPRKAARHGPTPVHRACKSWREEHEQIVRLVDHFLATGLEEREVAILYPRRDGQRIDQLCRFVRGSHTVGWVSNESDPEGGVAALDRPGVRLMTIHSAKGLEFPAVIVSSADQLPSPFDPDERRDANLLYVGLTRAMDHLAVTWTGSSKLTDRIAASPRAQAFGP